jgi:hypothetical protein
MTAPEPEKPDTEQVAILEALAEKAYDAMYDSRSPAACYGDLKDYFSDAIRVATRAGLTEEAERLAKRLAHCKQVYRSQFSGF